MSAPANLREGLIRKYRTRAVLALFVPCVVVLLPFLPTSFWLWGAVGLGAGTYSAWSWLQARKLAATEHVAERYQQEVIDDLTFTSQTFLGYGMEFGEYREAYDRAGAEKGRLSPEEKQAIHALQIKRMKPLFLSDNDSTRHVFMVAPTGLGKTELFQSVILPAAIKRGSGCVLFDAKGDEKLITRIYTMAREFHREEDVLFINFNKPEISHSYNPLLYGNTRQIVSTIMKLFDKRGEQFFRDISRAALTAALIAIKGQPRELAFNFMDLAAIFSGYHELERLYHDMPDSNEDKQVVWSFLKRFRGHDKNGNEVVDTQRYNEWLTGLANKMLDFSHSEYRRILNDYSPDIELKSAILGNKIIVVVIPALSDKEGVELFGKLFLGDFARAVGQIQEDPHKPSPPYLAFLDEYPSFADETHLELFQQARSANISLWVATQGIGFMSKVAPFFAENLAGNCWHHLYFDIRDPKSREFAAKLAGTTVRRYRAESEAENYGYSHENVQTGARRMESRGRSVSAGTREMVEDLITANDFEMDEGNAILLAKRGVYRMVLPMVEIRRPLPRLNEIRLVRFDKHQVAGLNLMQRAGGFNA